MHAMNRTAVLALLSLLLSTLAVPVQGMSRDWDAHASTLASGGISLDQAVQMAQARFNARVVRAETANDGSRVVYLLRLLSADGRVFSVRVDAQTGQIN
jgi:uncharacterized membrane protein YkoI